jgi:hypothetical protein
MNLKRNASVTEGPVVMQASSLQFLQARRLHHKCRDTTP